MIEHLFGSKTRVKLLQLFFKHPARSFYVRELVREIDAQLNAVRRELANLKEMGLLAEIEKINESENNPRAKYYKLRQDSLIYPELKALLFKSEILQEQEMVSKLKEKAGDLKLMLLTGHFINSTEVQTDILFVGQIRPVTVAKIIGDYEKKSGKEIRYTVMTEKEFAERKEMGDKFLYSILESRFVTVIDELKIYEN